MKKHIIWNIIISLLCYCSLASALIDAISQTEGLYLLCLIAMVIPLVLLGLWCLVSYKKKPSYYLRRFIVVDGSIRVVVLFTQGDRISIIMGLFFWGIIFLVSEKEQWDNYFGYKEEGELNN